MKAEVKRESVEPRPSSFVSLLSGWVQQAMESFFATQRILVDVAMRQNASAMKTMRESISHPEHSPTAILNELALEGTANFVEAQRILLDLVDKENELFMDSVKERVHSSRAAVAVTDVIRRSTENFVAMQQEFLTIASKQAQGVLNDLKNGKRYDANRVIEMAREGMENFVHTQKKLLDVISEETTKASSKGERTLKPAARTEISTLARESVNTLVEAQKKLLDVAAQQMKTNLKMARNAGEVTMPMRLPIAKLTGDGVKSFVDAEKALIDSMMKTKQSREQVVEVHRRKVPRRKPRRAKAMAATA
jgi:vacuolar-type H+-ATPase subunit E/Vma4